MWEALKRLFTKRKREKEALLTQLSSLQETVAALTTSEATATMELKELRDAEAAKKQKYDSKDPWVEITSMEYNEVKGIQISLDWNDAFVNELRHNGYTGTDDAIVVQKWLAVLYEDLMGNLEAQAIERSDVIRPNEFE